MVLLMLLPLCLITTKLLIAQAFKALAASAGMTNPASAVLKRREAPRASAADVPCRSCMSKTKYVDRIRPASTPGRPRREPASSFASLSGAHRRWASDERCAGLRAKGRARACECADTTKITPRQNMGAARYEIAARVSRAVFNVTSLMEQDKWCVRQLTQGRGEARARSRCGSPEMWIRNLWEWG